MHQTKLLSRKWNKIFLLFFFIFLFVLTFNDYSHNAGAIIPVGQPAAMCDFSQPLTKTNLRKQLDENLILCPEQVYAQIMIESGHLNSFLTRKTNNVLGMRFPFKRKTTAVGIYLPDSGKIILGSQQELKKYRSQNHYAVYNSWEECIQDYKLWQDKTFKLTERYLAFLGDYYAEDTLYVKKIRRMAKSK